MGSSWKPLHDTKDHDILNLPDPKLKNQPKIREKKIKTWKKMFFFFVGSVNQQVRQALKREVGRCIACGSPADLVEYEKVLKIFFVPVKRWPGKEPVMYCYNCNLFFPRSLLPPPPPWSMEESRLQSVTDVLEYRYCSRGKILDQFTAASHVNERCDLK